MSGERPTTRGGFFSRVFSGNLDDDDETTIYPPEEVGVGETGGEMVESRGFTVERAAEVIKNLPPEVPRPAAVRIVRGTLEAAGIDVEDLASSTRARESRLNSEIELSEGRIGELKEKPVVADDGSIEVRRMMGVTLACDHRILYGADGALFLGRVRELLEEPIALAL